MKPQHLMKMFALAFTLLVSFAFTEIADAARVRSVKGKKVLMSLSKKDNFKKGDVVQAFTKKGAPRGKIKIVSVKKRRAVGRKMGKGKIRKGYFVRNTAKKRKKNSEKAMGQAIMVGAIFGPQTDTMTVEKEGETKKELAGSSFSAKAFLDYPMTESWNARIGFGLQQLAAKDEEDSTCLDADNSPAVCEVNINYLSSDATVRYMFSNGGFRPWGGGFVGLLIPMSNDVTAIDEDSVATTSFYGVSFGFDYYFGGGKHMIPFQFDYGFYPPSDEVTANSIVIKIGYGFRW